MQSDDCRMEVYMDYNKFTLKLQNAIEDGSMLKLIQDCADQMYNGDIVPVLKVMKHNLSSALCNTKKRPDTPTKFKDLTRIELMSSFLDMKKRPVPPGLFWKGCAFLSSHSLYW